MHKIVHANCTNNEGGRAGGRNQACLRQSWCWRGRSHAAPPPSLHLYTSPPRHTANLNGQSPLHLLFIKGASHEKTYHCHEFGTILQLRRFIPDCCVYCNVHTYKHICNNAENSHGCTTLMYKLLELYLK